MPSYQYHFVVLAKTPARYSYVKTIDSVRVPFNGETEMDSTEDTYHYVVVELGADQLDLLPDNPLTWTSIAYVLWDQVDPGDPFPADQKKALVDWLHWGGQLIISGLHAQPLFAMERSGFVGRIGLHNLCADLDHALQRARALLAVPPTHE